jgi:Uma2 family endonuclease
VISPGDTYTEVEEKVREYLDAGVKAVWVVNPRRKTVTVYLLLTEITILTEQDVLDGGAVVPGASLQGRRHFLVATLFTPFGSTQ